MALKEIQPFKKAAFRQTRADLQERIHSHEIERAYETQVDFIARLLGLTDLSFPEINTILESEDTGNLLTHRLLQRLGLEKYDSKESLLNLHVDCEILDGNILGYTFEVRSGEEECPLASISYCNECTPELEIRGELVKIKESEWPKLMYGLVGLVEDIQALSESTD